MTTFFDVTYEVSYVNAHGNRVSVKSHAPYTRANSVAGAVLVHLRADASCNESTIFTVDGLRYDARGERVATPSPAEKLSNMRRTARRAGLPCAGKVRA